MAVDNFIGSVVLAKRLGWDEELTVEQEFDLDPYDRVGDDLEGPLEVVDVTTSDEMPALTLYLVGGQEADPKTVRPVENLLHESGEGA